MTDELLIVGQYLEPIIPQLPSSVVVHCYWRQQDPEEFLRSTGPRIRAVATDAFTGASAELMQSLPNLELVANFGVGYDTVDTAYAKRQGISLTNTPDVLNDDVADLAVGLMLATCRRICAADRFIRDGHWGKDPFPLTRKMSGRRLGVLGLGRIGLAVARRAEAFSMAIAYHNRRPRTDVAYRYYESPTALARAVDLLVVLVPDTDSTQRIVDREVLAALGPDGILINVARGSAVDETALVAALQDGTLDGAGLDVFAQEPNVPKALLAMENVVLQPHLGSATRETRAAMARLVVQNVAAFFKNEALLTPVEL